MISSYTPSWLDEYVRELVRCENAGLRLRSFKLTDDRIKELESLLKSVGAPPKPVTLFGYPITRTTDGSPST